MKIYKTWEEYHNSEQDAYLDEENVADCDIDNVQYAGLFIYGQTNIEAWHIYEAADFGYPLAILADADEEDVREYIKSNLNREPEYYYWLDTDPNSGFEYELIKGEMTIDGEKDRATEEVILRFDGGDFANDEEVEYSEFDPEWDNKLNAYIEKELGFLPDYEVN